MCWTKKNKLTNWDFDVVISPERENLFRILVVFEDDRRSWSQASVVKRNLEYLWEIFSGRVEKEGKTFDLDLK